jgi:hypothetical protein
MKDFTKSTSLRRKKESICITLKKSLSRKLKKIALFNQTGVVPRMKMRARKIGDSK